MTDSSQDTKPGVEQHAFSAEVGRLLDLVVHALYSEREIFLRELVANAADAMDKRRFEALTDPSKALPEEAAICIVTDKEKMQLTISDVGAGMSHDELAQNLGTIARSGTRAFGEKLSTARPEDRPSLIGQFGVGFYAAFMVADRVDVISRKAGELDAFRWSSEGKGNFEIAPATRDAAGTDIILHLKEDAKEFLDAWRLKSIIRKWADHITWPIKLQDGEETSAANEGTALWRKPKSDITAEQYTEFYRHVSHQFDEPYATLHWSAEGATEFTALLFIPSARPFDFMEQSRESKIHLHVKRMFITDDAKILPAWLRFAKGVVDTEDLPLNVSREMLQATPVLTRIRKAVTKKVLAEIRQLARKTEENDGFATFWENFGPIVKEGIWEDADYRQEIAGLSLFRSTHSDTPTTLDAYISRMKDGQEHIYYLTGDNAESLAHSAQLEGFRARGIEVLLLSDQSIASGPSASEVITKKPSARSARRMATSTSLRPRHRKGSRLSLKRSSPLSKRRLMAASRTSRARTGLLTARSSSPVRGAPTRSCSAFCVNQVRRFRHRCRFWRLTRIIRLSATSPIAFRGVKMSAILHPSCLIWHASMRARRWAMRRNFHAS